MKVEMIAKSDIEDCLEAERLMHELRLRLHMYKEDQEKQLLRMKYINTVANMLVSIKQKTGMKYPEDIRKEIMKRIVR
jgi:hypothetical protein